MKRRIVQLGFVLVLTTMFAGSVIADVQVQAYVEKARPIYAGSAFSYSIVVANGGQPDDVDLQPLQKYQPSGPSTQTRTSIVNGRSSSQYTLTYQLTAPAKGEYVLDSVAVTVDGKVYRTNPVKFSVVEPGTTKQIDAEMELSTQTCYVGQPVTLTMSFYVWTDIVRGDQIANLDIRIPILESADLLLEDANPDRIGGQQTVLGVNGRRDYVYQDQVMHDGVNCVRIRVVKILIPQKSGSLQVQPATVSADLAVGKKKRSRRDSFFDTWGEKYEFKRFGVQTQAISLDVQPLPQDGKPADFYGLVGNYKIFAEAAPTEVSVGDPITLSIRIGGSAYLKPVQWPDLEAIPEMAEGFKIPSERADGKISSDVKVFTQTIRPNHDGVTQIPPIPLSFFDAKTGSYRTVTSKPIELNVSPTRIVTGEDVESRQLPVAKKKIQAIQEGLSANVTSSDALVNQKFSPLSAMTSPVFYVLYVLPFAVLLGSAVVKVLTSSDPRRIAAAKRRRAYSFAVKSVRNAEQGKSSAQQVKLALQQYVADKFGKSAGALTAQDCRDAIFEASQDAELADRYRAVMEQTEASEYSPTAFEMTNEKQQQILRLLSDIEKRIK